MKFEINGKEVSFSYGLYFLGEAQDSTGLNIDQLIRGIVENPHKHLSELIYLSIKADCQLDEKPCPVTKREVIEWLDDTKDFANKSGIGVQFTEKLLQTLTKHAPKQPDESIDKEDAKKK